MKNLYAKAVGELILNYCERISPADIFQQTESNVLSLITEIKNILDNESLSDPECFYRIDAIVTAFHRAGVPTTRHWETD